VLSGVVGELFYSCIYSFIYSFIHLSIHHLFTYLCVYSFVCSCASNLFIYLFFYFFHLPCTFTSPPCSLAQLANSFSFSSSLIHLLTYVFICSFTPALTKKNLFIYLPVCLFVPALQKKTYSFTYLCVYLFDYSCT
jgi:hypothetical protein